MAEQYKLGAKRKLVNKVIRFMARRGKGPATELKVTGRSSGERISVMVTPVVIDGTTFLVSPHGTVNWAHNIRINPKVTLSKGGATTRYIATEVGKEEAGAALVRYYAEYKKYVADYMDIPGEKTITDFTSVAGQYPVFRLE